MHDPNATFEPLMIPRRELSSNAARYRVYKDARDYIMIEAANATEALKASGIPQPHRILRDAIYLENVLNSEMFAQTSPSASTEAPATPQADLPADAGDAPLSSQQVDQLLQG